MYNKSIKPIFVKLSSIACDSSVEAPYAFFWFPR
jgi:hypothetical protein